MGVKEREEEKSEKKIKRVKINVKIPERTGSKREVEWMYRALLD